MEPWRFIRPALFGFCTAAIAAVAPLPAWAAVQVPDCAAVETWAAGIDKKDRWEPIDGQRVWLPRAFDGDAFVDLFGEPALNWSVDDTRTVGKHIYECSKVAGKEKRVQARKDLSQARSFVVGALKGVLRRAERVREIESQKQAQINARQAPAATKSRSSRSNRASERNEGRLQTALDSLLAQADSPALLRTLARLRDVDFADPESYGKAFGQVEFKEARQLMQALNILGSDTDDPRVAPRLAARFAPLHDALMKQQLDRIAALDDSGRSLQRLERIPAEIQQELGPALTRDDVSRFKQALAEKGNSIRAAIVVRARQLVDQSPATAEGIARITRIAENTKKAGVTAQQYDAFLPYARARADTIADGLLATAEQKLADFPESPVGLTRLRSFVAEIGGEVRSFGTEPARKQFAEAATARMSEIAEAALPAFRDSLEQLPDDRTGLADAEKELASVRGWRMVDADLRAAYVEAATERRDEIVAALQAVREARREKAIAAGGDPELVGYTFVGEQGISSLEFRDEKRVMFSALGLKFAGTYEVDEGDVIVVGPHGQIVFTKQGNALNGMGLLFRRRP